ncbi:MAG: quinone-dependent dihydroorotate dehydrogenase [Halobacteriales archaeon]
MSAYRFLKPLLFSLPPERAHGMVVRGLAAVQDTPVERALARRYRYDDPRLAVEVMGLSFPNPVGVAAGFDKNARVPAALASLGFGHVEVGAVTAEPQAGNPRPRLFRLTDDDALVNRMGFNNEGADAVAGRLSSGPNPDVPLGVNIGKSKTTPAEDAPADYRYTFERLDPYADFVVVNVSSPNTEGLRELQRRGPLAAILETLQAAGADRLLVKLSPDLAEPAVADAVSLAEELDLAGIVATNTTTSRPGSLSSPRRHESGGLSGRPIEARATELVRFVADRTDLPVIGVGGVFTAADAYRKIRAGASLVQLYTGLVYRGPSIARKINRGLVTLLERDGFDSVADAVGTDA